MWQRAGQGGRGAQQPPLPEAQEGEAQDGEGWAQDSQQEEQHSRRFKGQRVKLGAAQRMAHFSQNPALWHKAEDTMVHFHKSFGVMQELFDHRDFTTFAEELRTCASMAAVCASPSSASSAPASRFLDLGCAPGGFSACLLQDHILGPNSAGWGISLPPDMGGFPMAVAYERLNVQFHDLLGLQSDDLPCPDASIDICVADAQNLCNFFKQRSAPIRYRGLKAQSRSLGIWALTVKECELAFAKLRTGGAFIFRFGWRGVGTSDVHPTGEAVHPDLLERYIREEEWYKALTHWLFSILKSLFEVLRPFKSEYVHQADVSFYMVCRRFDRSKYLDNEWKDKLQRAFQELTTSTDEAALVEGIKNGISDAAKAEIDDMLEYVGRMRAVGIQSRKVTNPTGFRGESLKTKLEAKSDATDGNESSATEQATTTCGSDVTQSTPASQKSSEPERIAGGAAPEDAAPGGGGGPSRARAAQEDGAARAPAPRGGEDFADWANTSADRQGHDGWAAAPSGGYGNMGNDEGAHMLGYGGYDAEHAYYHQAYFAGYGAHMHGGHQADCSDVSHGQPAQPAILHAEAGGFHAPGYGCGGGVAEWPAQHLDLELLLPAMATQGGASAQVGEGLGSEASPAAEVGAAVLERGHPEAAVDTAPAAFAVAKPPAQQGLEEAPAAAAVAELAPSSRGGARSDDDGDDDRLGDIDDRSLDLDPYGMPPSKRYPRIQRRRAGRMVRERRQVRERRNVNIAAHHGFRGISARSIRYWLSAVFQEIQAEFSNSGPGVQAVRFGLFCAMAWSMNSLVWSMIRIARGEVLQAEQ